MKSVLLALCAMVVAVATSLVPRRADAQVLQQTSCAVPGGTNATSVSTVNTDVEATFASVADACNFVATAALGSAQCSKPTAFTVEWQLSTAAVGSNGSLQIFAVPDDGECATFIPANSTDYFYNGLVSGVPSAVSEFPGGAGNSGDTLTVQNGRALDTRAIMEAAGCCDSGGTTSASCDGVIFDLCVVVRDNNHTPSGFYNAYLQFYVDTVGPPPVTGVIVSSGDGRLGVSWKAGSASVQFYLVTVYNADGTVKDTYTEASSVGLSASFSDLANDATYSVTVAAIDYAGNHSAESAPISFTPRNQCDAWECYSGKEKGGFCFISTAAYGSYDGAVVQIFRDFRDQVLLKFAPGRALVLAYYKHGVSPAVWLAQHAWARRAVAAALLPIGLAAAGIVRAGPATAALVFALLLGLFVCLRRYAKAALVLVLFLALPHQAHAQSEPVDDGFGGRNPAMAMDPDFDEKGTVPESEEPSRARVGLAFKLGSYRPNVDSDPAAQGWYKYYFGQSDAAVTGAGRKLYFFWEGDVYLYRAFGLLGVSGGVGYWQADARSRVCADASGTAVPCTPATLHTSTPGTDTTSFKMVPLTISVVYKLDVFLERWRVPLVPFLRAGFDCDIWWLQGSGRQAVKAEWMGKKSVSGMGATFGAHLRPGLALDLGWSDFLHLMQSFHISTTALTFEWRIEKVNDFGSKGSWDLSDSSFLAGLEITI